MPAILAPGVADFVTRIAAQNTVDGVWAAYMATAAKVGLRWGFACFLPGDRAFADTIFANAMPPGWAENYAAQNYHRQDPLAARSQVSLLPFHWHANDWQDPAMTAQQQRWHDDNMAAGLRGGIVVPDRSGGNLKVISLAGENGDLHPADRMALHFGGLEALLRMQTVGLGIPGKIQHRHLSDRERECMSWVAAGKSDWEIGCILAVSEKTVNTHIERAKHKLGATTRAQAMVIALRAGAINL